MASISIDLVQCIQYLFSVFLVHHVPWHLKNELSKEWIINNCESRMQNQNWTKEVYILKYEVKQYTAEITIQ